MANQLCRPGSSANSRSTSTSAPTRTPNGADTCSATPWRPSSESHDAGGGNVIVVDADNQGLLGFYTRHGFKSTGIDGDPALYMKVSTARKTLQT